MMFNDEVENMIKTPTRSGCLARLRDLFVTKDFKNLSDRHKVYLVEIAQFIQRISTCCEFHNSNCADKEEVCCWECPGWKGQNGNHS